jgi:hypothetical protein
MEMMRCQPWHWRRGEESEQEKKVNKVLEIPHYTYIFSEECKKGEYKLKIERTVIKSENRKKHILW